jgi:class 3 adenylate cyclase
MSAKYRIPITAITVFGTSSLLALTVGIVLYLGFSQAAESTLKQLAGTANTLIDSMEQSIEARLAPIRDQALWVANDVRDLSDPASLDEYMFGSLAATPQVAGVAIITPDGNSRRWQREGRLAIDEDWSQKPWMQEYLELLRSAQAPSWREPIFTQTVGASTLLHDIPLHDANGEFVGIFAQILTLKDLSTYLSRKYAETGITPFVLYNRDFVLSHPAISIGSEQQPLSRIDEMGDLVLQRIWSPDETDPFIARELVNTNATGIYWGDNFYLYLYRDIEHFGPAPWTVGAYVNMALRSTDWRDRILGALLAGIAVLVLAVLASVIVGRKVSSPIKEIVNAANTVDAGKLDSVGQLSASHIREIDDAGRAFNSIPVQQTEATILFSDIEGFTSLTETLGPVKIVDVLNAFFSAMVDILEQHGGVVTQFQGDAILATFNVPVTDPNHAGNAIRAAQAMLDCVATNPFEGEILNIRIGINTGSVVAGAIGAKGRLNYTVHGDAVNLAARLEALNKEYGSRLLISESSAAQAKDFELSRIGEVTVRGQTRSINLFTLNSATSKAQT